MSFTDAHFLFLCHCRWQYTWRAHIWCLPRSHWGWTPGTSAWRSCLPCCNLKSFCVSIFHHNTTSVYLLKRPGNKLMITIILDSPLMLSTKTQDISLSKKERVPRKILPSRLRWVATFDTASVLRISIMHLPGCTWGPGQPLPDLANPMPGKTLALAIVCQ